MLTCYDLQHTLTSACRQDSSGSRATLIQHAGAHQQCWGGSWRGCGQQGSCQRRCGVGDGGPARPGQLGNPEGWWHEGREFAGREERHCHPSLPSMVNFHPLADGLPSAGVRKNACRTRIRSQINGCCLVRTSRRVGGVRRAAYSFVMLTGVVGKVLGTPSLVSRLLLGVLEGTAVACSERDCR